MDENEIRLSSRMYNMLVQRHGIENVRSGFVWDGIRCSIYEDKSLEGNSIVATGDMAITVMKLTLLKLSPGR